jgi:hypothetical protein
VEQRFTTAAVTGTCVGSGLFVIYLLVIYLFIDLFIYLLIYLFIYLSPSGRTSRTGGTWHVGFGILGLYRMCAAAWWLD